MSVLMKLNIGAGNKRIPGYFGVDAVQRQGVDLIADADSIPLPDGCAIEVMAIHLCEHLLPWRLPIALREWHRLLVNGGSLILEMPDLYKACQNIIDKRIGRMHPDQLGMWGLFGDATQEDEHMLHRYAYSFETIKPLVEDAGFSSCTEQPTQFHGAGKKIRDFRLEARKAGNA